MTFKIISLIFVGLFSVISFAQVAVKQDNNCGLGWGYNSVSGTKPAGNYHFCMDLLGKAPKLTPIEEVQDNLKSTMNIENNHVTFPFFKIVVKTMIVEIETGADGQPIVQPNTPRLVDLEYQRSGNNKWNFKNCGDKYITGVKQSGRYQFSMHLTFPDKDSVDNFVGILKKISHSPYSFESIIDALEQASNTKWGQQIWISLNDVQSSPMIPSLWADSVDLTFGPGPDQDVNGKIKKLKKINRLLHDTKSSDGLLQTTRRASKDFLGGDCSDITSTASYGQKVKSAKVSEPQAASAK